MSEFMITLPRDWDQDAQHQPVTEMMFREYEEADSDGFVGEISFSVELETGRYLKKTHRMRLGQFRFFVDEIAARYHAGGPK